MKNDFREFYDEEYIVQSILEDEDFLEHAWKNHKYLYIDKNGNYVYPEDLVNKGKRVASNVGSAVYNTGRNLVRKASPYVRSGVARVAGVAKRAVQVGKQELNRRQLMKEGKISSYDENSNAKAQRRKNMLRYIIKGNNPGNAKYKNLDAINNKIKQNEANRLSGDRSKTKPAAKPGEKWKYDSKNKVWIRTQKASMASSGSKTNSKAITTPKKQSTYRTDRLKDEWTPTKKTYGGLDTKSARNEKFGSKSSTSSSTKKKNTFRTDRLRGDFTPKSSKKVTANDILSRYSNIGKNIVKNGSSAAKTVGKNAAKSLYNVVRNKDEYRRASRTSNRNRGLRKWTIWDEAALRAKKKKNKK